MERQDIIEALKNNQTPTFTDINDVVFRLVKLAKVRDSTEFLITRQPPENFPPTEAAFEVSGQDLAVMQETPEEYMTKIFINYVNAQGFGGTFDAEENVG